MQKSKIPTIRIATPIVEDGIKKGIVIMNVNMAEYLEDIKKATLYYVDLVYDDGSIICNDNKYNSNKDNKIKNNISSLYPFIPKDISRYDILKTDKFLLYKFPLDTPRKIYMVLVPKKFNQYIEFESNTKKIVILLIFITLLGFPIGYIISSYIEKNYLEKIDIKKQIYIDEL
ncbi:MAG: hypothetical protein L3J44_10160, partial [Campylobacteraceae bacterium]|nr:hypothetical protein [Campylobacteraceae bacterium]